jgi:hypothetical protein
MGLFSAANARISAFSYGGIVIAAAIALHRTNIKKHFTETYLHVAAIVLFTAALSGVFEVWDLPYLIALVVFSAITIAGGIRFKRFAFVVYGIGFGYLGVTVRVLKHIRLDTTAGLAYLVFSGLLVIVSIIVLARRLGNPA